MSHLTQLRNAYLTSKKLVQDYAQENRINDFHDGDDTYYKLLHDMWKAYYDYRKEELLSSGREYSWIHIHKPVLTYKINRIGEKVRV